MKSWMMSLATRTRSMLGVTSRVLAILAVLAVAKAVATVLMFKFLFQ